MLLTKHERLLKMENLVLYGVVAYCLIIVFTSKKEEITLMEQIEINKFKYMWGF